MREPENDRGGGTWHALSSVSRSYVPMQAIQYLTADYQPTAAQSEAGITQLTKSLAAYDLTKPEKLQIVNLAPTEPVELYVVRAIRLPSPLHL